MADRRFVVWEGSRARDKGVVLRATDEEGHAFYVLAEQGLSPSQREQDHELLGLADATRRALALAGIPAPAAD